MDLPGNRTPISWLQAKRLPVGRAARFFLIHLSPCAWATPVARAQLKVRPGIEPCPPPYRGGALPQHLQTNFSSDPGWNRTINFLDVAQASSPLDHGIVRVTGVRVELTNSRGSRPRRFTNLRTRPLQVRVSHPTGWAYEARLSTGSPASCFFSDQGESRTPTPRTARRSERRMSTSSITWSNSFRVSDPCGTRTRVARMRVSHPAARRTGRTMGREGIEPLVIHLACFVTTALQAATRITTHNRARLPQRQPTQGGSPALWHRRDSNPQSRRFELRCFADLHTVPLSVPDGI